MPVPKNRERKIVAILRDAGCSEERISLLRPLIEQTVWLERKLEQGRNVISSSSIVVPYDNGGGQTGIRKNPAFEAIHRMNVTYNSCLKTLAEAIPETQTIKIADAESSSTQAKRDVIASLRQTEAQRGGTDGE